MIRQAVKNVKCTVSPPIVSHFGPAHQAVYLMSCGHICSKTNRCNVLSIHNTKTDGGGARLRWSSAAAPKAAAFSRPFSAAPNAQQLTIFISSLRRHRPFWNCKQCAPETSHACLDPWDCFAFRKVWKMCHTKKKKSASCTFYVLKNAVHVFFSVGRWFCMIFASWATMKKVSKWLLPATIILMIREIF